MSSKANQGIIEMAKINGIQDGIQRSNEVQEAPKTKSFITLVACCASLGGLIFGYDIGGAGATFVMDGKLYR